MDGARSDAGKDVPLLAVQLLHVLLPDGLELFHAQMLWRPHHRVCAGVLGPPGELSCQEEVSLIKRWSRV